MVQNQCGVHRTLCSHVNAPVTSRTPSRLRLRGFYSLGCKHATFAIECLGRRALHRWSHRLAICHVGSAALLCIRIVRGKRRRSVRRCASRSSSCATAACFAIHSTGPVFRRSRGSIFLRRHTRHLRSRCRFPQGPTRNFTEAIRAITAL